MALTLAMILAFTPLAEPVSACIAGFGYTGSGMNSAAIASSVGTNTGYIVPTSTGSITAQVQQIADDLGPVFINLKEIIFEPGPTTVSNCSHYENGPSQPVDKFFFTPRSDYPSRLDAWFSANTLLFQDNGQRLVHALVVHDEANNTCVSNSVLEATSQAVRQRLETVAEYSPIYITAGYGLRNTPDGPRSNGLPVTSSGAIAQFPAGLDLIGYIAYDIFNPGNDSNPYNLNAEPWSTISGKIDQALRPGQRTAVVVKAFCNDNDPTEDAWDINCPPQWRNWWKIGQLATNWANYLENDDRNLFLLGFHWFAPGSGASFVGTESLPTIWSYHSQITPNCLVPPSQPVPVCEAEVNGQCFVSGPFDISSHAPGAAYYKVCRSEDTPGWGGCEVNVSPNTGPTLTISGSHLPSDGFRRAYRFRVCDSTGLCSKVAHNEEAYVEMDLTPPTAPGPSTVACDYTDTDCWVRGNFTVNATAASDAGSGVERYKVCRSQDSNGGVAACNQILTAHGDTSYLVSGSNLPSNGFRRAYWFRGIDAIGHHGAWNTPIYVRVDRNDPTVSANNASNQWFTHRTATVSAADSTGGAAANSGLVSVRYRWNGPLNSACSNGTATGHGGVINVPPGDNHLYLCAKDNTGRTDYWDGGPYRVVGGSNWTLFDTFEGTASLAGLNGRVTPVGNVTWSTNSAAVTYQDMVTTQGFHSLGALAIDPALLGDSTIVEVHADVDPTSNAGWSGVGISDAALTNFGSAGQFCVRLNPDNTYKVYANGASSVLASGTTPGTPSGGFHTVEVKLDSSGLKASVKINGSTVFGPASIGITPSINYAGLHLREGTTGQTRVDNFYVTVLTYP